MRSSLRVLRLALPVLLATMATVGCKDATGRANIFVRAELVRLPGRGSAGQVSAKAYGVGLTSAAAIPWTSVVTVTSVQSPITVVGLFKAGSSGVGSRIDLYSCPAATISGCLVELNGPELQNLLGTSPVSVPVGTYDRAQVGYCLASDTTRRVFMTGTAPIGGATYYTRTTGTLSTTGPAQPVAIDYTGCASTYPISPPLVITDSITATTNIRLYFDMFDIASAVLPSPQASNIFVGGPCTPRPTLSTPFVCLSYPDPIAVVGTVPPVTERYRVNGGATIGLVFDATTDLFYGGYVRRYLVEDQPWNPGFGPDAPVGTFTPNSGGTYRMAIVPSSTGVAGPVFPAWRRTTHTGTITFSTGTTAPYSAVRLP